MASEVKLNTISITMNLFVWITLLGLVNCQTLQIFPSQSKQEKAVGKPVLLTCRPNVPDGTLLSDLRWTDSRNITIQPKSGGSLKPAMYTEYLQSDSSLALIFPIMEEKMKGKYYCSASYGVTQQLATFVEIDTFQPITWKDAPELQNPILGDDYIVRCEVTANPPATTVWFRSGDIINTGGRYVVDSRGLLIKNVSESDDGSYSCRASVIITGELQEKNIRVEVQIKPVVSPFPSGMDAVEGQTFSTYCNATGKPTPEFAWVKQSTQQNLETADRFFVNKLNGQLSINRVEKEDNDAYICVAKNAAGISEARTRINVLVRPNIYELMNITVANNEEAILTCRAFGRPQPKVTFKRHGFEEPFTIGLQVNDDRIVLENISEEKDGVIHTTAILRISKLARTDDGLYECIASNRGDTAYKMGHITVEYPPNFDYMKTLAPVYSWEERRANLSCLAEGFPNATIEWRWNDKLITEYYDKNFEIVGKGPRSDLLIFPRDNRYYSKYKCIAVNRLGTAHHYMELRLATVPGYVAQARPSIVTATAITFEIIPPAIEEGLMVRAYTGQWKELRNPDWTYAKNRTWSPDSPYIVEGLKPDTRYVFRFAARNDVGLGPFGAIVEQGTPKRSEPEVPKVLHAPIQEESEEDGEAMIVTSPYADHFELRWNIPADNGEPIDYYKIRYCPGAKINGVWTEFENSCLETEVPAPSTNYEMRELSAETYFSVKLSAHNAIGYSKEAHLLLKTARGKDEVLRVERYVLSSGAVIAIVVGVVLLLLLIVDAFCCMFGNLGLFALMCRRTKRSPSDLDEETKLGSGSLIKERPPSPLPLPPPVVKLGPTTPLEDEKQPLSSPTDSIKKNSTVEFDGKIVQSRSGEIIGKNSAV